MLRRERELRDIVDKEVSKFGGLEYSLERRKTHYAVLVDGVDRPVTASCSPSDPKRANLNFRSNLRTALRGMLPRDEEEQEDVQPTENRPNKVGTLGEIFLAAKEEVAKTEQFVEVQTVKEEIKETKQFKVEVSEVKSLEEMLLDIMTVEREERLNVLRTFENQDLEMLASDCKIAIVQRTEEKREMVIKMMKENGISIEDIANEFSVEPMPKEKPQIEGKRLTKANKEVIAKWVKEELQVKPYTNPQLKGMVEKEFKLTIAQSTFYAFISGVRKTLITEEA